MASAGALLLMLVLVLGLASLQQSQGIGDHGGCSASDEKCNKALSIYRVPMQPEQLYLYRGALMGFGDWRGERRCTDNEPGWGQLRRCRRNAANCSEKDREMSSKDRDDCLECAKFKDFNTCWGF